jgi:hypothetical protein
LVADEAASLLPGGARLDGSSSERARHKRRLEKLAIEVLTATERDATIAATEQRGGAALRAMITDES